MLSEKLAFKLASAAAATRDGVPDYQLRDFGRGRLELVPREKYQPQQDADPTEAMISEMDMLDAGLALAEEDICDPYNTADTGQFVSWSQTPRD